MTTATPVASFNVPLASYPIGTATSPVFTVPDTVSAFQLVASRNSWPVSTTGSWILQMQAWISYDGGTVWNLLIGFTANGGDFVDKKGILQTTSKVSRKIKPKQSVSRKMKVMMNLKVAISTQLTLNYW